MPFAWRLLSARELDAEKPGQAGAVGWENAIFGRCGERFYRPVKQAVRQAQDGADWMRMALRD